eukprot:ctg_2874.g396
MTSVAPHLPISYSASGTSVARATRISRYDIHDPVLLTSLSLPVVHPLPICRARRRTAGRPAPICARRFSLSATVTDSRRRHPPPDEHNAGRAGGGRYLGKRVHLTVRCVPARGAGDFSGQAHGISEHGRAIPRAAVSRACLVHGAPRQVLILGGGDGGAAREFLKWRTVERVVVVDIDAEVVTACREHLPEIHRGSLDDARVEVVTEDAWAYVDRCGERFEVIVSDLTDPLEDRVRHAGRSDQRGRVADAPPYCEHAAQRVSARVVLRGVCAHVWQPAGIRHRQRARVRHVRRAGGGAGEPAPGGECGRRQAADTGWHRVRGAVCHQQGVTAAYRGGAHGVHAGQRWQVAGHHHR